MSRHIKTVNPAIRSSSPKRPNQQRVRLFVLEDRTTPVTFADGVPYQSDANPSHLATADLDGDGDLDVVFTSPSGVNTFQNDGKGALSNLVTLGVGGIFPSQVAIGDLTGDGKPDLVVGVSFDQHIAIFKGNGNGTFQAPILQEIGLSVETLTIADFNGDGKTDIAFATNSSGMGVLINDGSANVVGAPSYFLPDAQTRNGTGITSADFNGDGFADIAYIDYDPGNKERLTLFISQGDGMFSTTGPEQTGAVLAFYDTDVIAKSAEGKPLDFNGDGKVDLAIGYGSSGFVGVFLGKGDGTFQAQNTFSTGQPAAGSLSAADFDQDGKLDISASVFNSGKSGVPILLGDGKGNLGAPSLLSTFFDQNSVQAADLNTDGYPDLLTTLPQSPGTVNVFFNTSNINYVITSFDISSTSTSIAGQSFGLTVTARDQFGATFPGYTGTVHFSSTDGLGILPSDYTFVAGDKGQHTFPAITLKTAGNQTVTVQDTTVSSATGSKSISVTPAQPAIISAISGGGQSATVNTAFAAPLIAKISDAFGNAVPGAAVTFEGPLAGPGVTFSGSPIQLTDGAGQVSISASANTKASSFNVSSSIAGIATPALFNLTNLPGSVASFVAESGSNQSAKLNQSFASPLVVRVADSFGNPIPNITVSFTSPNTGAGVTFLGGSTAVSDATGTAAVQAAANGYAGTYTIVASVSGVASPANFALTNVNTAGPNLIGFPEFSVGSKSSVNFYNPDGTLRSTITPFGSLTGGLRTAAADFTGDGIADLVVGTGPGGPTHVKVLDGVSLAVLFSVDPFEVSFTGGIYVAAGDINGDGKADLAITPDEGGGPRVRVFTGAGFTQIADFFGIDDKNFRGGARTAIGDMNGDGSGDLVVVAGFGGGPRVAAFNGAQLGSTGGPKLFNDFFAFEQTLRNGIFVAAGDVNGDGFADLVAAGGPGGGPRVFILDGKSLVQNGSGTLVPVGNFFAGDVNSRGGVRVAVKNLDNDAKADVVTGAGRNAGSRVTAYLGDNITPTGGTPPAFLDFDAFAGFGGGVFVG